MLAFYKSVCIYTFLQWEKGRKEDKKILFYDCRLCILYIRFFFLWAIKLLNWLFIFIRIIKGFYTTYLFSFEYFQQFFCFSKNIYRVKEIYILQKKKRKKKSFFILNFHWAYKSVLYIKFLFYPDLIPFQIIYTVKSCTKIKSAQ